MQPSHSGGAKNRALAREPAAPISRAPGPPPIPPAINLTGSLSTYRPRQTVTRRATFPPTFIVAVAAVTIVLVGFAVIRTNLWTYGADSGTFARLIANTPAAMYDGFERGSHFRVHWSPILALLYPVVVGTHSLLALQISQILLVVGSICVFYLLIEPHVGRRLAVALGILALLYPPLPALAFSEFHELSFAPLLIFAMLLAIDRRRWGWYAVATAFALCVREDFTLIVGCFGILLLVGAPMRRRPDYAVCGALTAVAAAGVLAAYFFVVVPRFGAWSPSHFYQYPFADGPVALLGALISEPRVVLQALATWQRGTYLLEIVVPLALLPLLSRWVLLALPALTVVLLANSADVWRMGMHYEALWLPWILVSCAAAVRYLQRTWGDVAARRWTGAAIAASVGFLLFANPMHVGHYLRPSYHDLDSARRALDCVPRSSSLATHDEWYSAIALDRPQITGPGLRGDDYYVFAEDYPNAEFQRVTRPALLRASHHAYRVVCRYGSVAVYRRQ